MVPSPVTGKPSTLVMTIPVQRVVDEYRDLYNISIERHFKGLEQIELYQCPDTGYRFFYPFSMAGDEKLYDELQQFPWYYLDWKWEYGEAPKFIKPGSKVLEVGCGEGKYLQTLKEKYNCHCTGIELNLQAVNKGKANDLDLRHELVQEHAKTNEGAYDVVYFFQVLEHIADIHGFVEAAVACLKPGGTLMICVPNNEPFLFKSIKHYGLNLPPHHMGWWNTQSLKAIAPYFGLEVQTVYYQPITLYHIPGFVNILIRDQSYGSPAKRKMMRMLKPWYWARFVLSRRSIPDAHILGVYTKK